MLAACSAPTVCEAEAPAVARAQSAARAGGHSEADGDALRREPGPSRGEAEPVGELEFAAKAVVDGMIPSAPGKPHRVRVTCLRVPEPVSGQRVVPGAGKMMSRYERSDPPWEIGWKMTGAPGKYVVFVEVDGSLKGKSGFELLPSGSAFPQVVEVKVGPPEW
jgi:hypothetical protein